MRNANPCIFAKGISRPVSSRQRTSHLIGDDPLIKNKIKFSIFEAHLRIARLPLDKLPGIDKKMVLENRFEKAQEEITGKFNPLLAVMVPVVLLGVVEESVDEVAGHAAQKVSFGLIVLHVRADMRQQPIEQDLVPKRSQQLHVSAVAGFLQAAADEQQAAALVRHHHRLIRSAHQFDYLFDFASFVGGLEVRLTLLAYAFEYVNIVDYS